MGYNFITRLSRALIGLVHDSGCKWLTTCENWNESPWIAGVNEKTSPFFPHSLWIKTWETYARPPKKQHLHRINENSEIRIMMV